MTVKIYLNPEKTITQVINPLMTGENKFNGNVKDLVSSVNNGVNYGYEIIN